jgi:hypothetical protein
MPQLTEEERTLRMNPAGANAMAVLIALAPAATHSKPLRG